MGWTNHGLVIKPTGAWWNKTHCMMPTPEHISGSLYRIYYGGRNDKNQSHIGYADIDLDTLNVSYCEEPVLSPGPLGRFDDNGVLPSCMAYHSHLYYVGFKPGGTTRMRLIAGLALKSEEGFKRWGGEWLRNEIGIATAPWECRGNLYYVNGIEWVDADTPRYDIWRVNAANGADAPIKEPERVIELLPGENALARPYVVKQGYGISSENHETGQIKKVWENAFYRMLFSAKGRDELYRPQYAESRDGLNWERKPYDFPEEHMCYMIALSHDGKEFMFYNDARNYGRDGICLAVR